jgi:hypothetical protein
MLSCGPHVRADLAVSQEQTSVEQQVSSSPISPGLSPIPTARIAPPPSNAGHLLTVYGVLPSTFFAEREVG